MLVQALAKGDRDELAVQAAAELGVDEIVPWQASRSVSRWDAAKAEKGRARWAGIVREAAKQAHRAWVPDVAPVATTTQLAARAGSADVLVLEPTADERLSIVPLPADRDIVLVVGPEGGIAPAELDLLSLGRRAARAPRRHRAAHLDGGTRRPGRGRDPAGPLVMRRSLGDAGSLSTGGR